MLPSALYSFLVFSLHRSEEEEEDSYRRNDKESLRDTYGEQETVEVFREKTIEDMIDEQRAKLAAEGKVSKEIIGGRVCGIINFVILDFVYRNKRF